MVVQQTSRDWIYNDQVICIDFYSDVLGNRQKLDQMENDFGNKTEGVLKGCFGALDGWIVKIRCPSSREVANPGKYYCRKG